MFIQYMFVTQIHSYTLHKFDPSMCIQIARCLNLA